MKLYQQVKLNKSIIAAYEENIDYILSYLNTPKFHHDTTVQVGDIRLRIEEMKREIFALQSEA